MRAERMDDRINGLTKSQALNLRGSIAKTGATLPL
jgi:hypothetical protein